MPLEAIPFCINTRSASTSDSGDDRDSLGGSWDHPSSFWDDLPNIRGSLQNQRFMQKGIYAEGYRLQLFRTT